MQIAANGHHPRTGVCLLNADLTEYRGDAIMMFYPQVSRTLWS